MTILRLPHYNRAPNSKVKINLRSEQAKGLVGCWATYGAAGGMIQDFSPYRNHATLTNNPPYTVDSELNRMVDFEISSSQYARIPSAAHLVGLDTFTAMIWMRVESVNVVDQSAALGCWDLTGTDREWLIELETNGTITGNVRATSDLVGPTLTLGKLYHIALSYDNLTWAYFYVNGELVDDSSQVRSHQVSNSDLGIGARIEDQVIDEWFDGKLQDARIYNRLLTPEEIYRIYDRQTRFDLWEPVYYPRPLIGPAEIDLVVENLSQTSTVSKPSLVKNLDVKNLSQSHTADRVDFRGITVLGLSQAHTTDKVPLTTTYNLQVEDLSQSHTVEKSGIVKTSDLVLANLSQANTVDHTDLFQVPSLTMRDLSQDNLVEHITTERTFWLGIHDLSQDHTVEVPWVNTHIQMYAANLSQANKFPKTTLTQTHNLGVHDTSQFHETITLTLWDWWHEIVDEVGLVSQSRSVVGYIEQSYEEYGFIDMELDEITYIDQSLEGDGEIAQEHGQDAMIALTHEQDGEI